MKILVTGASGFIGSHLIDRLIARSDEVGIVSRPGTVVPADLNVAKVLRVDLLDPLAIASAISQFLPDAIIHLAAQSLPVVSWEHPWETLEINIGGTLNILEAARRQGFPGPILLAGSSSEYATQHDAGSAISEDYPVGGSSPYAVSKVAVDQLAQLYVRRYGLSILRMRPFFWIGTRKVGDFCSDMARQIVRVESGRGTHVAVGNLDAVRDLLDVRDGIEAMLLLLERGVRGDAYNICSGIGVRMFDVLQIYSKMSDSPIEIRVDSALLRPLDEPVRIGDPSKLLELGWRPRHPIADSLYEILQYWRCRGADA